MVQNKKYFRKTYCLLIFIDMSSIHDPLSILFKLMSNYMNHRKWSASQSYKPTAAVMLQLCTNSAVTPVTNFIGISDQTNIEISNGYFHCNYPYPALI